MPVSTQTWACGTAELREGVPCVLGLHGQFCSLGRTCGLLLSVTTVPVVDDEEEDFVGLLSMSQPQSMSQPPI